jgi:hypothetical protein
MYEGKGRGTAALFGQQMSTNEARGIVHEVSVVADKIDRLISGKECPGLSGDKGVGDARAYWESVFGRDLEGVLLEMASHFYKRPIDEFEASSSWMNELHVRTRDLLTYGVVCQYDFLEKAELAIPQFSKLIEMTMTGDAKLDPDQARRRLAALDSLFETYPAPERFIKSIFVSTPEYGVVTVVKYRMDLKTSDERFSIGVNTSNLNWDSAGYNFDKEGQASSLFLINTLDRIATLKPGFTPPSADALCRSVVEAFRNDKASLTSKPPPEPNMSWFV